MLFIGKTDWNLITKLDDHDTKADQPMYQHLGNFSVFNDHIMLFTLLDAATNTAIIKNVKILNKNSKWSQLQFLEAYYIRHWHLKLVSA